MKLSKVLKSGSGILFLLIMVVSLLLGTHCMAAGKAELSKTAITMSVNQKKSLKLRISSGKIIWKILSGKKFVSIKNDKETVVITAKRKEQRLYRQRTEGKNLHVW